MNIEEDIKPLKILMSKYKQIDEMNNCDHELALVIDYTELSAIETILTAYEKEKEKNKELESYCNDVRKEMNEENRRCMLLAVENQNLKEKNKDAIDFINDKNNYFEDGENWQNILKIKEILEE